MSERFDLFSGWIDEAIELHPFLHDTSKVFKLLEYFDMYVPY